VALIPCKECGNEISNKAITCPNCGIPIPNKEAGGFKVFFGRVFGTIPPVCRKCRSKITYWQRFCKTCGTYFPFHESNAITYNMLGFLLLIWLFKTIFPLTYANLNG